MLMRSGLFLFLLTFLKVSARSKSDEPDIKNAINIDSPEVSSSSSRIISGWEAQPGQHPHHASVRFMNSAGGMRQCGGSIISREWVVTAAFCTISRIRAVVHAGGVTFTNSEYLSESTEWYNHPTFNNLSTAIQQNDISLLKLQSPLVYTSWLKPIRVQSSADAFRNYEGEVVYASGHGRTETADSSNVLRWVYLRALSNAACSRVSANVRDTTICAQYFNVTSQITCFGDNGGPLVHVDSDGIPTLIGISYYFPLSGNTCDVGRPAGFVRPGAYLPWFKEVTGIDFENLQETDITTTPAVTTSDLTSTTSIPTTTDSFSTTTPAVSTTDLTIPTNSPTTTDSTSTTSQVPDETTTAIPDGSEESEEDSGSNEDDDNMLQLLKRLVVYVKVKVGFNKYNVQN